MSQALKDRLARFRDRYSAQQVIRIQELANRIQTITFEGKRVIAEREHWGKGYLKPKQKYVSRFDFFIYLLFMGEFHLAKQSLEMNNLPLLDLKRKSVQWTQMSDQIMYEIITVLENYLTQLGV